MMMTCRHVLQLADDDEAFAYARSRFAAGQAEGAFPLDRPGPSGGEQCLLRVAADGQIVGFATFYDPHDDGAMCWVDLIWIEPNWRHRGQCRALLREAGEIASKQGIKSIHFGTLLSNQTMQVIAQMMGFAQHSLRYSRPLEAEANE